MERSIPFEMFLSGYYPRLGYAFLSYESNDLFGVSQFSEIL